MVELDFQFAMWITFEIISSRLKSLEIIPWGKHKLGNQIGLEMNAFSLAVHIRYSGLILDHSGSISKYIFMKIDQNRYLIEKTKFLDLHTAGEWALVPFSCVDSIAGFCAYGDVRVTASQAICALETGMSLSLLNRHAWWQKNGQGFPPGNRSCRWKWGICCNIGFVSFDSFCFRNMSRFWRPLKGLGDKHVLEVVSWKHICT